MSNETRITINGRLTAAPELRFTPSGAGVANFSVAVNARKFNKQSNEWVDQPTKFWRCQAWNQGKATLADNVSNMLAKGDVVIVHGEIETREYTTKDGEKRSVDEIRVESIGKDLRWHGQSDAQTAQNAQDYSQQSDPWAAPDSPPF